jgi:hypothetical protein
MAPGTLLDDCEPAEVNNAAQVRYHHRHNKDDMHKALRFAVLFVALAAAALPWRSAGAQDAGAVVALRGFLVAVAAKDYASAWSGFSATTKNLVAQSIAEDHKMTAGEEVVGQQRRSRAAGLLGQFPYLRQAGSFCAAGEEARHGSGCRRCRQGEGAQQRIDLPDLQGSERVESGLDGDVVSRQAASQLVTVPRAIHTNYFLLYFFANCSS